MTASKKISVFILPFVLAACAAAFAAGVSSAADAPAVPAAAPKPPYTAIEAVTTIIDPHTQISDEGHILWEKCIICHRNVPDLKKEKSISDVTLRYANEMKDLCLGCHIDRKHPGTEGASVMMSAAEAPDHLVVPSQTVKQNLRLMLKSTPTIFPFDPKTGKVTCVTCHNPHEKGLQSGKAGWGAGSFKRLRAEGDDICQYCHRK
ncbi:MAG: hypothetical protein HZB82_08870 [Deltaproteobacteria bacterium]|nr:hypothetical protein [Deltaproteobacteria bacterium]